MAVRRSVSFAVLVLVVTAAATVLAVRDKGRHPTAAELRRLEARVSSQFESGALARAGIYLSSGPGRDARCVSVALVNPTTPNVQYLRRTFGSHLCVFPEPVAERGSACLDFTPGRVRAGDVPVPNILGMRAQHGQRRLVEHKLRFTRGCLENVVDTPVPLSASDPDRLLVVVDQCPRAGERVPEGTAVAYRALALFPGGFTWRAGALPSDEDVDSSRRPICRNGRDVFRARDSIER